MMTKKIYAYDAWSVYITPPPRSPHARSLARRCRKAAALATYREVEEEWERKQEEIATTKRINAAKKEVEREARVKASTALH